MNIVTPQPAMSLNTSNVYTETARRDNQLREVIPKPAPSNASHTENRALNDGEKSRPHLADDAGTYDSTGQLQQNKVIAEDEEQQNQQQSKGGSEDDNSEQEKQNQEAEQQQIEELKARDREVRLHEQAHARVGGQYAGSPSYEYQRGPDGNNYAVGGQVMIDVAEIPNDPKATIDKMQTVRAAALAPAEPSGADRAIAADATQKMASAQADLAQQVISGDEPKSENSPVASYETRRLNEDDRSDNEIQTLEKASLHSEGDPYAVALPIEPDPEIQARAMRISDFYQHVAVPNTNSSLSLSV
jgi:hypothetical protein